MKLTKGLTWPTLVLALATTLVFMAGLASLQHGCYSIGFPGIGAGTVPTTTPTAAFGMSDGFGACSRIFRFYWFVFAFAVVTLLGLLVTSFSGVGLHTSRPFWVGMVSISAVLMMIASEAFLGFDKLYKYGGSEPGWWYARWRTATAGAIMSVIAFILLLLAIGTDWEHRTRGARHGRDEKMAGTTTERVAVPVGNVRVVDQV